MRPAKRILLCSSDVDKLSTLTFVLRHARPSIPSCCYDVSAADDEEIAMIGAQAHQPFDLVLIARPFPGYRQVLKVAKDNSGTTNTLVLSDDPSSTEPMDADRVLHNASNGEMLELVSLLTRRKRGPRKRSAGVTRMVEIAGMR